MTIEGKEQEGCITKAVKTAQTEAIARLMHESEKPTVTRARKAILGSDPPMRKMIGK